LRYRLPLLVAFVASLEGACTSVHGPTLAPARMLPPTSIVTLDGTVTDLRSVLHGRVGMVSLWATWCVACVNEMEALARLQAQAGGHGDAVVIGVAVGETREVVATFARKVDIGYPQFVDEDFRLADALGQNHIPATLVVDRSGNIVFRGGALDSTGLAAFRTALQSAAQ
jgi:thiol-disulfide isomerase/thioredoxin